eukprot:CAMPEP_0117648042 /NCGR_PEP_ID=MMETSP0804-20121206/175_1 /TAXON_ID=1074897 /ORGANISM="Tetraselmis astigmatica, Strain CCMP880" /LENGTH=106 /DNA_ID=CAMNT_0005453581 /DNA_START=137 /DNA_END=457 /DNA_ORIENTATION=+
MTQREHISFRAAAETVRAVQRFLGALNPTYEYGAAKKRNAPASFSDNTKRCREDVKVTEVSSAPRQSPPSLKAVARATVAAQRLVKSHGHKTELLLAPLPQTAHVS